VVEGEGGGLFVVNAASVTGTEVDGNTALLGGGVHVTGGRAVLTDVSVHDNADEGAYGGGIFVREADLELLGTTEVHANRSGQSGGGIAVFGGTVTGGVVRDNEAAFDGGGLSLNDATVTGVVVSGNRSRMGGGVAVQTTVTIAGCTIAENEAAETGGGVVVLYDEGPSVDPLRLTDTAVTANSALEGGGIYSRVDLEVEGGQIADNVASGLGGGVRMAGDPATLTGVTVVRNIAQGGGGVALDLSSSVSSFGSDFGSDADDNLPDDVWTGETGVSGYGAGATFACAPDGCTPAP
jgi:hypothetical protein